MPVRNEPLDVRKRHRLDEAGPELLSLEPVLSHGGRAGGDDEVRLGEGGDQAAQPLQDLRPTKPGHLVHAVDEHDPAAGPEDLVHPLIGHLRSQGRRDSGADELLRPGERSRVPELA
jgi:hypothetical protein